MANYRDRLLSDAAKGVAPLKRGRVTIAEVHHEDRCKFWDGMGDCDCEPTIVYKDVTHLADAH